MFKSAFLSITAANIAAGAVTALGGYSFSVVNDSVMGGKSVGKVESSQSGTSLKFSGTINTNGGGFASCRAPCVIPSDAKGVRLKVRGDGRLYKCTLRTGRAGPTFQHDFATAAGSTVEVCGAEQVHDLPFEDFMPSIRGRSVDAHLVLTDVTEIGFMLSLKTMRGLPNPEFGTGVFNFAVIVDEVAFY